MAGIEKYLRPCELPLAEYPLDQCLVHTRPLEVRYDQLPISAIANGVLSKCPAGKATTTDSL
jgi:hypothetical protein